MRKKDTWAGELEAIALARTVDCTIYIMRPDQPTVQCGKGSRSILVKLEDGHFEPLRSKRGSNGSNARREHAKQIHKSLRWSTTVATHFRAGGGSSYAPSISNAGSYAPSTARTDRAPPSTVAPTLGKQSVKSHSARASQAFGLAPFLAPPISMTSRKQRATAAKQLAADILAQAAATDSRSNGASLAKGRGKTAVAAQRRH